jgi:hypothetical protein
MLGEKLSLFNTASILLGFGALAMIIFGNTQTVDSSQPSTRIGMIPYLMLIALPI